jgi:hypothetical protein
VSDQADGDQAGGELAEHGFVSFGQIVSYAVASTSV